MKLNTTQEDEVLNVPRRRPPRWEEFADRVSVWQQIRALFLKTISLQLRAIWTNLCQIFVPLVMILFAGIMQVVVNNLISTSDVVPGSNAVPIPINVGNLVACTPNATTGPLGGSVHPGQCYDEVFNAFLDFGPLVKYSCNADPNATYCKYLSIVNNLTVPSQQLLFDLPFYYVGNTTNINLGNVSSSGGSHGFLDLAVSNTYRFNFTLDFAINPNYTNRSFVDNGTYATNNTIQVPFFVSIEDRQEMDKLLTGVITTYNDLANSSSSVTDQYSRMYIITAENEAQYQQVLQYVQARQFQKVRPHGGIFFDGVSQDSNAYRMNYTLVVNDLSLYSVRGLGALFAYVNFEVHRRNNVINMISNAVVKNLTNNTSTDPIIVTYIAPLPAKPTTISVDILTILSGLLFPFATSFLLPVFVSKLVKDRFEKQVIMMEQNGLDRWTYWLVTYVFDYLLYICVTVVVTMTSLAFSMRLFTQTHPVVIGVVFLLWGHAQIVLAFFLSNFFSRPRTSIIIGYLLVIASVIVAEMLSFLQIFPTDETPFFLYMMYPPFIFYRILFYLFQACSTLQCYSLDILSTSGGLNLVTTAILYLAGVTVLLIFVSIYLSFVLPGEYGVRKSPLFPILAVYNGFCHLLTKLKWIKKSSRIKSEYVHLLADTEDQVDVDVQNEEDRISREFPEDAPMVMYKLRKVYPGSKGRPPHVAVSSLSLVIERNECFGLLGPNGAGKTTLISVLTGLYEPTSGEAKIAGYDLETQTSEIHHHLGVCPQFDIHHPELTAREHLLFYARLKGVKISKEAIVVERALREVNLLEAANKKSSELSGGMRRRLSVAMACIGNPDILILDEPTTGLDPASRRQVWEVIENVKEERSVILTTHAMEEADHLCTRIGIMNYGQLRCLGTQSHLKSKFGTGYQLHFSCDHGKAREAEQFIQMRLPSAMHVETYADSCKYKMNCEDVVVSELFELLDGAKNNGGIRDWGIKRTTLEDVFLNIVRQNVDTRVPIHSSCFPHWMPCANSHCLSRKTLE